MQKDNNATCENRFLKKLMALEDLAEKKTKIYSRLLMDAALASDMEQLSLRHEQRKQSIEKLIYGKCQKPQDTQGRCEINGEEGQE